MNTRRSCAGFTLVEVLVAMFVMALMAAMAWQGVDNIARTRESGDRRMEQTLRIGTVITQWEQDLAALHDNDGVVPALAFDGATLRLTRRTEGGVQLVAWSLREGRWQRWASPAMTRVAALQESWLRSQQLLGNEPQQMVAWTGVDGWQVYFYRNNAWSNAQSTGDVREPPAPAPGASAPAVRREQLPTGVRLVLTLNGPLQGALTRDVMLAPQP